MSNVVVTLGGVPFQDFEVPEKIRFGGAQRVAVNQLIGGGRVVNALGEDDGEILLGGVFSGADAASRAQALDALRAQGSPVALVWDEFFYTVVVAEFAAEYAKPWWIPFALRCVVVSDLALLFPDTLALTANLIGSDIGFALGLSGQAGISLAGLNAGGAGFPAAQQLIGGAIATGGAALSANVAALDAAPDAAGGIAAMGGITANSSQLAALTGLSGYVNRAAANIAGALL